MGEANDLIEINQQAERYYEKKSIQAIANEIRSWLPSAVMDIAGDENEADRLYEDVATIKDLIGDRTYDDCGGDLKLMIEVATTIIDCKYTGTTLRKAYTAKRKDRTARLKREGKKNG